MSKKIFFLAAVTLTVSTFAFSKESDLTFSVVTDLAYYPETDFGSGSSHYENFSGAFDGLLFRSAFYADWKIPAPLGEHWLVKDSNVVLESGCEISPVTIKPLVTVSFSPLPFLEFKAGSAFGTGWKLFSFEGLSEFNDLTCDYDELTPFKNWYMDLYFQGTFMFDTGAIIQKKWSHIVTMITYQISYKCVTGVDDGMFWEWQTVKNQCNGWQYYVPVVLAYQMPLVVYRAGLWGEFYGHFNEDDFGKYAESYNGSFVESIISPFVQLKFSEKDNVIILAEFRNRRSFLEEHSKKEEEPLLNYSGQEWFFNRLAFRYTHYF